MIVLQNKDRVKMKDQVCCRAHFYFGVGLKG